MINIKHRDQIFSIPLWLVTGIIMVLLVVGNRSMAASYPLPPAGEDIIGELETIRVSRAETLLDVALRHDLGHEAIIAANPDIDPWLPEDDAWITLPSQFILPDAPRTGIVINLPEMRLYYYPKVNLGEQAIVITHPISIGSEGRNLPMGLSKIGEKEVYPSWVVPQSIRDEHAFVGDVLPAVVPPGPDNPLGKYSMRLDTSSYLIHGTNRSFSIGMRISHGCIRMYPGDIESLYPLVPKGTPVRIINQPFKVGWRQDELYIEAHAPLRENKFAPNPSHYTEMVSSVINASNVVLDEMSWKMSWLVVKQVRGIPGKILPIKPGESVLGTTALLQPDHISGDSWWLQAGAFQSVDKARQSANDIGQQPTPLSTRLVTNGRLCRVVIGPFAERIEALKYGKQIFSDSNTQSFLLHSTTLSGYRYCQP